MTVVFIIGLKFDYIKIQTLSAYPPRQWMLLTHTIDYSTTCGVATCHEVVILKKSAPELINLDKFGRIKQWKTGQT